MTATGTEWTVKTLHSRYVFNTVDKTFTRERVAEKANDLGTDHVVKSYDDIYFPGVGESMIVYMPDGEYIRSTPVLSHSDENVA